MTRRRPATAPPHRPPLLRRRALTPRLAVRRPMRPKIFKTASGKTEVRGASSAGRVNGAGCVDCGAGNADLLSERHIERRLEDRTSRARIDGTRPRVKVQQKITDLRPITETCHHDHQWPQPRDGRRGGKEGNADGRIRQMDRSEIDAD